MGFKIYAIASPYKIGARIFTIFPTTSAMASKRYNAKNVSKPTPTISIILNA